MTVFNIPRNQRTPTTEIDVLLTNLSALYSELHPGSPQHEFINTYFKECYENENTSGDVLVMEHEIKIDEVFGKSIDGVGRITKLAAIVISCAYCCQGLRAFDEGRLNEAWTFVVDARHYCGFVMQRSKRVESFVDREKITIVSNARRNAQIAKHELYYGRQERFVDEMYLSKHWKNKEIAATEITNELLAYIAKESLPAEKTRDGDAGCD